MKNIILEKRVQYQGLNSKLLVFALPRTPKQAARELGIKKLRVKSLLEDKLIEPLNPDANKGRLYTLTGNACRLLDLPGYDKDTHVGWDIIGWTLASPRQRYVILLIVSKDYTKRTSENIRHRSVRLNPYLSRISTKETLKELIRENLVETEKGEDRRRYYWINNKGRSVISTIDDIFPDEEKKEKIILRRGYSS